MIVRIGLLLTAAFVINSSGTRTFDVARDSRVSASRPVDTGSLRSFREVKEPAAISLTSSSRRDDDVDDTVDLYGNEVTAAVATYKLDGTGALYELHSPQTEVPQLPPPKS